MNPASHLSLLLLLKALATQLASISEFAWKCSHCSQIPLSWGIVKFNQGS